MRIKGQVGKTYVDVICHQCGGVFSTLKARLRFGRGKYCSVTCLYKFEKGKHFSRSSEFKKGFISQRKGKSFPRMSKESNPNWKGGKPGCSNCKKQLSSYKAKVCKPCQGILMRGRLHWNWKNGLTKSYKERYRLEHKEEKYHLNRKRRIMKAKAEGSHTLDEWNLLKSFYNYMCLCCKRLEPEIKLTEDHIIPVSMGGTDYISNIQPLCRVCNSIKNIKIIDYRKEMISS